MKRLLSAYLNKFVTMAQHGGKMRLDKQYTIAGTQKLLDIPEDLARSISFGEFCMYISGVSDACLNEHWRPQWWCLGRNVEFFDHMGQFENLEETFTLLKEKFGYVPETDPIKHNLGRSSNITRFNASVRVPKPYEMLPRQSLQFKNSGFPLLERFITPDIESVVRERYKEDYGLIKSLSASLPREFPV